MRIRFDTGFFNECFFYFFRYVFVSCADETMRNVFFDGGRKKTWLLQNKTYLGTQPFQVEVFGIHTVDLNGT